MAISVRMKKTAAWNHDGRDSMFGHNVHQKYFDSYLDALQDELRYVSVKEVIFEILKLEILNYVGVAWFNHVESKS